MLGSAKAQQVAQPTLQQRNRRFHAIFSSLMKIASLFFVDTRSITNVSDTTGNGRRS